MIICKANNGNAPAIKRDLEGAIPHKSNPTITEAIAEGWREYCPMASTPANARTVAWIDDGARYAETVTAVWTQEELDAIVSAQQAAAEATEAARKATPIVYDQAIEAPLFSVLSQTSRKGIGITATDEGDLVTVIIHESPWPDKDTLDAKIAASIASHKAAKDTARAGISGQLQTRIENIERMLGLRL